MTPNEIIALAKKRLKNSSASIDWNTLFKIVIDDIFTRHQWKFSQRELNYIHNQQMFEKTFDLDSVELSLMKIKSIRCTPFSASARGLTYVPLQTFRNMFPDLDDVGSQEYYTELHGNDGTNGMQIGIYRLASDDFSVWIDGDFKPSYTIDNNELPILPVQWHRLVFFGLVMHAADESDMDKLSLRAERWYEQGLVNLEIWDRRNPNYFPVRKAYDNDVPLRKGPFFPSNFPLGVGR